jgi:hypothetical protein
MKMKKTITTTEQQKIKMNVSYYKMQCNISFIYISDIFIIYIVIVSKSFKNNEKLDKKMSQKRLIFH